MSDNDQSVTSDDELEISRMADRLARMSVDGGGETRLAQAQVYATLSVAAAMRACALVSNEVNVLFAQPEEEDDDDE